MCNCRSNTRVICGMCARSLVCTVLYLTYLVQGLGICCSGIELLLNEYKIHLLPAASNIYACKPCNIYYTKTALKRDDPRFINAKRTKTTTTT